jgi:hypothetical protein
MMRMDTIEDVTGQAYIPKTFCILPDALQPTQPYGKRVRTLAEYAKANTDRINSEATRSILFQLIWTLAILQKRWPGFQHNDFASSVQLKAYGGGRTFRIIKDSVTFCIPEDMPLPIITKFTSANGLAEDSHLRYRKSGKFDALADVKAILRVLLTKTNRSSDSMSPAVQLETLIGQDENATPAMLLYSDVFADFSELIDTMARAQVYEV